MIPIHNRHTLRRRQRNPNLLRANRILEPMLIELDHLSIGGEWFDIQFLIIRSPRICLIGWFLVLVPFEL